MAANVGVVDGLEMVHVDKQEPARGFTALKHSVAVMEKQSAAHSTCKKVHFSPVLAVCHIFVDAD